MPFVPDTVSITQTGLETKMMAYRWICVSFVFIFCNGICLGEDDLVQVGKERATAFSLQAEFDLSEYLMTAEMSIDSSPESEFLFSARPKTYVLQTKDYRAEGFTCRPTVLADDRQDAVGPGGGYMHAGPFTSIEIWERLTLENKSYELLDGQGLRAEPALVEKESVHELRRRIGTACIKPFDWPLLGPNSFESTLNDRDCYATIFGKDRQCVFARQSDDRLETHWLRPSPSARGVCSVVFQGGLPVCNTLYVFSKSPVDGYELDEGIVLVRSETKWRKAGDTDVPEVVVSTFKSDLTRKGNLVVVANIGISLPGDKAFEEKKKDIDEVADSIKLLNNGKQKGTDTVIP